MEVQINQPQQSSMEMRRPRTDRRHLLSAPITASSGKENYAVTFALLLLKIKYLRGWGWCLIAVITVLFNFYKLTIAREAVSFVLYGR